MSEQQQQESNDCSSTLKKMHTLCSISTPVSPDFNEDNLQNMDTKKTSCVPNWSFLIFFYFIYYYIDHLALMHTIKS